jgi:hypothetical protein
MATAGGSTWRFPLLVFLVWRLAHAVAVVALGGHLFDDTFRFDSLYYLDILGDGYEVNDPSYQGFEDVSFMPGLPWITWVVRLVLRNDRLSAFVVANAFAGAAFGAELSPPWVSILDAVSFIVDKLPGLAAEVSLNLVAVIVFLALGLWWWPGRPAGPLVGGPATGRSRRPCGP